MDPDSAARAAATVHVCLRDDADHVAPRYEADGFQQVEDVLDTWFSSALWPHSTLGWPEKTAELDYFYPTNVLITSRDIITLWVACMVLTGLNNMGEIPFHEVYINPKILDGYGETMSKSKGNGVDPVDVIDKFGADALRFGLAHMTTETQDVRMPVQFECPHCGALLEQTKENRDKPRVQCTKCKQPFRTQWARTDEDKSLPRGPVVSERFEVARNFCNKLWNASRFVMLNMGEYVPASVADAELAFEDRWILSRLAHVTRQVTEALDAYRYAEAARTLYDFSWDEFCSSYVEMVKGRLQDPARRAVAQRVVAHALDSILRLLHPIIPFITEEVWQLLGNVAPARGLTNPGTACPRIITAPWPTPDAAHIDLEIERQFDQFHGLLSALREIRSRQNIAPKVPVRFAVRCDTDLAGMLEPLDAYFQSLANATAIGMGPDVAAPPTNATVPLDEARLFVDLDGLIDVAAERQRLEKEQTRLQNSIAGKQKKLDNANFTARAPAEVVQRERDSLAQLRKQLELLQQSRAGLG